MYTLIVPVTVKLILVTHTLDYYDICHMSVFSSDCIFIEYVNYHSLYNILSEDYITISHCFHYIFNNREKS